MEVAREQSPACSSGCESGWTAYFDEESDEGYAKIEKSVSRWRERDDDDLSMVSDASSGPPQEESNNNSVFFCCSPVSKRKRVEQKTDRRCSDPLDDTASSHLSSCFKQRDADARDPLEASYSFSTTHFKEKASVRRSYMDYYYKRTIPSKSGWEVGGEKDGNQ